MALTNNEAAVLKAVNNLEIEQIPVPEPADNEVLLKMGSVGICGSDITFWKSGRTNRFILKDPMIVGHEGSGTVVKVGSKVKSLKIGDRVAIEPGTPDRCCIQCKSGRYNLCPNMVFCATPPDDGNICRYYKHAEDFCFKLSETMSLDEGALVEPLAVAIHACRRGEVTLGTNVLICGAGPVGIMCLMAAKISGATKVLITDINDFRLETAKSFGADHVFNVTGRETIDAANQIEAMMGGQPEVTIECSSSDYSFELAIHGTKPGGNIIGVGRPNMKKILPLGHAFSKEIDIKGVFRYVNCYPKAIEMIRSGKVDVKSMITHHFPLKETLKAFETFSTPEAKALKVIVHCDQ